MCSPAVSPLKSLPPLSPPDGELNPYNRHSEEALLTQPTLFQHPIRTKSSLIHSVFFPEKAFTLLPSDLGRLFLAPLHQLLHNSQGNDSGSLDIISRLPDEISVKVLLYLTPQDLCNASSVCSRWYQLTQHSYLYKKRKDYLQHKRVEYKESKENYPPFSPPPQRRSSTTSVCSPLNSIQPVSPPPPLHHSQPASPTGLESSRSSTPSPTFLAERVSRLSLTDQDLTLPLRQSLFSKLTPSAEGEGGKYLKPGHLHPSRHTSKEGGRKLIKKKNRLRRL